MALHENVVQDSLQVSGAYMEIELLCPCCIPALTIFWASGLAREVDWNTLQNSVRMDSRSVFGSHTGIQLQCQQ